MWRTSSGAGCYWTRTTAAARLLHPRLPTNALLQLVTGGVRVHMFSNVALPPGALPVAVSAGDGIDDEGASAAGARRDTLASRLLTWAVTLALALLDAVSRARRRRGVGSGSSSEGRRLPRRRPRRTRRRRRRSSCLAAATCFGSRHCGRRSRSSCYLQRQLLLPTTFCRL
jgi:hypothetical protein